ncbi:MAG TPA: hypothetical protein VFB67_02995 [Candidatus Polarisedimenticolaceae bacterium]|nr:hypothetical protein [Candidatus Polarisedimenticolaceae bacterium]
MRRSLALIGSALAAITLGATQTADVDVLEQVRSVEDRIAAIVRARPQGHLLALRADEAARNAEARVRADRWLSPAQAAARGRAWRDVGLGSGPEPGELLLALASDLDGMTLDASRTRLLVDPERLRADDGRGDPEQDAESSVLLATGVAPDEPVAGHYAAHALLDGADVAGPVTTDALLARASMAEGSANLAALLLLFGGVGLESEVVAGTLRPEDALGGRLVPGAMRSGSPAVTSLLQFVYLDGFAQMAALAKKADFGHVSRERQRRKTTRDVLHLDRAPAAAADLAVPAVPAGTGLSVVDRDVLGEQGIISLVSLTTGKDNLGMIAGDGWIGDALFRLEAPAERTDAGGLTVWVSRWATEEDAKDFAYGVERCLQARFPAVPVADDPGVGGRVLRESAAVHRITRSGVEVRVQVASQELDARLVVPEKKKGTERRGQPPRK